MKRNSFYLDVLKAIAVILLVILLCRLTHGVMSVAMLIVGLVGGIMRKPTMMICALIVFPLIAICNRALVGLEGFTLLVGKVSFAGMVAAGLLSTDGRGLRYEQLPVKWLFAYVGVACLSSMDGWMPLISYLKLLNFSLMLIGLCLVAKMMQTSVSTLRALRAFFMAMSIIFTVGSLLSYYVPSIGFSMTLYRLEDYGVMVTGEELIESGSAMLFNGMTCHSQVLSPVVSCLAAWTLCDMLLIERRMTILHCLVLLCVPGLLYMSRSRGGLLMLACIVLIAWFLVIPRAKLPFIVKRRLGIAVVVIVVGLIGAGVYFQLKNEALSRWLRKTDDVAADTRSLSDAFTGSRRDSIEMNMRDFSLNPLLGKGFQVIQGMDRAYESRMVTIFSASVEKGVTPYVILGETGLLGAGVFLLFLFSFYRVCLKRGHLSLLTNFSCFLVANLADSTFFSPSGMGGFMWMVACIGAFSTDCLAKRMRQDPGQWCAWNMSSAEDCVRRVGEQNVLAEWRAKT